MQPLGPYPLTVGSKAPIAVNWGQVAQPPIGVEVSNVSGLLLQVELSGQTSWLEPWTAKYFPVSGNVTGLVVVPSTDLTPTGADPLRLLANLYQVGDGAPSEDTRQLTGLATVAAVTGVVTVEGGSIDIGNTPNVNVTSGIVDIGAGTVDVGSIAGNVDVFLAGQELLLAQFVIPSAAWPVGGLLSEPLIVPKGIESLSVYFNVPSGGPYTGQIAIGVSLSEPFVIGGPASGQLPADDDVALLSDITGGITYDDCAVIDCIGGIGASSLNLSDVNTQKPATIITVVGWPVPAAMVRARPRLTRNSNLLNYPEWTGLVDGKGKQLGVSGNPLITNGKQKSNQFSTPLSAIGSHVLINAPATGFIRVVDFLLFTGGTAITLGLNGGTNLLPVTVNSVLLPGFILTPGAGGLTFANTATGGNAYTSYHDEAT